MIIHSHKYSNLQRNYLLIPANSRHSGGFSSLLRRRLESDADRCCGGDRRHSGGFLLRIMPPSCHPVPACTPRLRCRRAVLLCSNDGATSIPKSEPEIKNRCTQEVVDGLNLAAIAKSPEIRNRCSRRVVAFCRRNHSPSRQRKTESDAEDRRRYAYCRRNLSLLQQRKLVSDADLVATTTVAGETILLRGNENQNRTRTSLPLRP